MDQEKKVTLRVFDIQHYIQVTRGVIAEAIPRLNRALDEIDNLDRLVQNESYVPKQKEMDLRQDKHPDTKLKSKVFRFDDKINEFNGC